MYNLQNWHDDACTIMYSVHFPCLIHHAFTIKCTIYNYNINNCNADACTMYIVHATLDLRSIEYPLPPTQAASLAFTDITQVN